MSRSSSLSGSTTSTPRPTLETAINSMQLDLASEVWLNERVCFTLTKTAEQLVLQRITGGATRLSTVAALRSFMLAVASILDMPVPTMKDKELSGTPGIAFDEGSFLNYVSRFRRLSTPVFNSIISSSINKSSMNRKLSATGHVTEEAQQKAEECKQDFTRFFHANCSDKTFSMGEQLFTVEILREQSVTVIGQSLFIARFATKDVADRFLTALKAEKIAEKDLEVKEDKSYRQKSRFVGENVFSVALTIHHIDRLGKYELSAAEQEAAKELAESNEPCVYFL